MLLIQFKTIHKHLLNIYSLPVLMSNHCQNSFDFFQEYIGEEDGTGKVLSH